MDAASWFVAVMLQATALLLLAWLVDRLLVRRVWPQLLQVFWGVALLRFFLPPELGSPWSLTAGLGERVLATAERAPAPSAPAWLLVPWLGVAVLLLVLRALRRRRLGARVVPAEAPPRWTRMLERAARRSGFRRRPRLGTLEGLTTPAVLGLLRPVVLLPREWLGRAPTRRDEHALMHECAHLRRRDLWLDELCACVRALLWFHPLVWLGTARIHALGELACDQSVARALGGATRSYRETLVRAAQGLLQRPDPSGLRAFLGHPNALVLRIARLGGSRVPPLAQVRLASVALVLVLGACVLPMAPASALLRARARAVLAAERDGVHQSCFALQAAALVLAAEPQAQRHDP